MLDLKKRLGALIPGDAARGALQNVLTVEWSGHKTVLVEVPAPSGPSESNEVEMLGMSSSGRDNNNYGRLSDEDERVYLSPSAEKPSRERRTSRTAVTPKSSKNRPFLPDRPPQSRAKSDNPFYSPEEDEYSLQPTYATTESYVDRPASRDPDAALFSKATRSPPTRTWTSFDTWAANPTDPWGVRGGQEESASPTSSTGTRSSGTGVSGEDPFR